MYADLRLALEDAKPLRAPRQLNPPHYVSMIFPFGGFGRECRHDLSPSEISAFRKQCVGSFRLAVSPSAVVDYNNVDQGQDGACTFVGLLNLIALMGRKDLIPINFKRWRASWRRFDREQCEDLAECLDLCASTSILGDVASTDLRYVPVRSRGNREMSFNVSYWVSDLASLAERYGAAVADVEATPWLYQNARFVEELIDSKRAVAINFAEHTRTCVGYNDDSLLFCDNWSKEYEENADTNGTYQSLFKGGLSVCGKWACYSWMREVVYVEERGGGGGDNKDNPIIIDF
ncbi:hypothetical protein TrRE_jg7068 [Triparma retinervis]|uniref:Uncharacterized protein n=1 Tax=Triparma retinervis TaxID=2557542 RepID=A0A9W7EG59_9STRA|nr:hypothetical protein TrRE_jg7068 [Triparma retinervis]